MSTPLKLSVDFNNLSRKERFLMGFPFLCPRERAYQDIVEQLKARREKDLEVWQSLPEEVSSLAKEISETLKSEGVWPSSIFIPEDPADIVFALHFDFTDTWDVFPISYGILSKKLGVDVNPFEFLRHISYVESIEKVIKKKAEQTLSSAR